ncbi:MAG: VapE family protein [Archangium sp.]|nr:VapE family protein [Archangium sp.]
MSVPGGGDITELLRRLGADALIHELERAGHSPRSMRSKCPWVGCEHKGKDRERDAQLYAGKDGHYRVHCHACDRKGDLIDLFERTRGWNRGEAIAHLKGVPVPERPRPELRVVGNTPPEDEGKLRPSEVQRLWDALGPDSQAGRAYLEGRGLGDAIDAKLVRFTNDDSPDKQLSSLARRGYRVAALTYDVVGQPRGLQARLVKEPKANEPKIMSVKGSVTGRAFFGEPGRIEESHFIAVAEGLADTLALSLWVEGKAVVVGAAGKGSLGTLAVELEGAGIDVTGKLFALFPQNDRPELKSHQQFLRLKQLLHARGARTCSVKTPEQYADLAEWRRAKPEVQWPPPEVQLAYGDQPGDDQERKTVLPDGQALPMRKEYRTDKYAQNLTTLTSLFDDPSSREALLLSREELSFCKMTTRLRVGGREVVEEDFTKIRVNIEQFARSTDNKPLQFSESDIEKVLTMLAARNQVHEVQRWLGSLPAWDQKLRLEADLANILGHETSGLAARLLRRWMVSAVARAMEPGCKVDTVLILTGKGGGKKSTFFDALGGQWFTDADIVPGDKDGMLKMRQAWIVEWGELESMKRSRSGDATKKFLSTRVDLFRAPYGKDTRRAPRHCVFGGTSNDTEILNDSTGTRRYWPIEVLVPKINVKWLRENREQLFAEALALYSGGLGCPACATDEDGRCADHRWWLTDEEDHQLEQNNRDFEVDEHPWLGLIENWLTWPEINRLEFITTGQVMKAALRIKEEDWSNADAKTVAASLKRLGWRNGRDSIGSRQRGWLRPRTEGLAE